MRELPRMKGTISADRQSRPEDTQAEAVGEVVRQDARVVRKPLTELELAPRPLPMPRAPWGRIAGEIDPRNGDALPEWGQGRDAPVLHGRYPELRRSRSGVRKPVVAITSSASNRRVKGWPFLRLRLGSRPSRVRRARSPHRGRRSRARHVRTRRGWWRRTRSARAQGLRVHGSRRGEDHLAGPGEDRLRDLETQLRLRR